MKPLVTPVLSLLLLLPAALGTASAGHAPPSCLGDNAFLNDDGGDIEAGGGNVGPVVVDASLRGNLCIADSHSSDPTPVATGFLTLAFGGRTLSSATLGGDEQAIRGEYNPCVVDGCPRIVIDYGPRPLGGGLPPQCTSCPAYKLSVNDEPQVEGRGTTYLRAFGHNVIA